MLRQTVKHNILVTIIKSPLFSQYAFKYNILMLRYVSLVAVGVQEQAEDILVPPLLRNCLTLNYISFPSHYLPSRTVVLVIVFTV